MLETHIRRRVVAHPQVSIRERAAVQNLIAEVQLAVPLPSESMTTLAADLYGRSQPVATSGIRDLPTCRRRLPRKVHQAAVNDPSVGRAFLRVTNLINPSAPAFEPRDDVEGAHREPAPIEARHLQ